MTNLSIDNIIEEVKEEPLNVKLDKMKTVEVIKYLKDNTSAFIASSFDLHQK